MVGVSLVVSPICCILFVFRGAISDGNARGGVNGVGNEKDGGVMGSSIGLLPATVVLAPNETRKLDNLAAQPPIGTESSTDQPTSTEVPTTEETTTPPPPPPPTTETPTTTETESTTEATSTTESTTTTITSTETETETTTAPAATVTSPSTPATTETSSTTTGSPTPSTTGPSPITTASPPSPPTTTSSPSTITSSTTMTSGTSAAPTTTSTASEKTSKRHANGPGVSAWLYPLIAMLLILVVGGALGGVLYLRQKNRVALVASARDRYTSGGTKKTMSSSLKGSSDSLKLQLKPKKTSDVAP